MKPPPSPKVLSQGYWLSPTIRCHCITNPKTLHSACKSNVNWITVELFESRCWIVHSCKDVGVNLSVNIYPTISLEVKAHQNNGDPSFGWSKFRWSSVQTYFCNGVWTSKGFTFGSTHHPFQIFQRISTVGFPASSALKLRCPKRPPRGSWRSHTTGWWLNQPIWKIWVSQNGFIFPKIGMNIKKSLKTPTCQRLYNWKETDLLDLWNDYHYLASLLSKIGTF